MDIIDKYFEDALLDNKKSNKVYRCHIQQYFKVIEKNIDNYFKTKQPYEEHIKKYWYYLQRKAPKTIKMAVSNVKCFLGWKDKQTRNLDIWDTIHTRLRGKTKPITPNLIPDRDEIRQILHYTDICTKTVIMMRCTSGMRLGELCKLLPDDIFLNETPTRINVRAEIAKNGQRRTTFISSEATNLLREWNRTREKYVAQSLKTMNFHKQKYIKNKLIKNKDGKIIGINDDRIFPYESQSIGRNFNVAAEKAGFVARTKMKGDFDFKSQRSRRHLSSKNLRHFFRTYLGNVDIAEFLMGHSGYLTEYRGFNDKQLAKEYLKNVANVTIFERPADISGITKDMEQLKRENREMKQMILELRLEKLERQNGIK